MIEGGNADKLRKAGLIADRPLADRYYEVIDGLSEEEVNSLISVKRRLDEAGIPTAPLTGDDQSIVVL
jgi:hypothetical protein